MTVPVRMESFCGKNNKSSAVAMILAKGFAPINFAFASLPKSSVP